MKFFKEKNDSYWSGFLIGYCLGVFAGIGIAITYFLFYDF